MKQFLQILFGGLVIIFVSVFVTRFADEFRTQLANVIGEAKDIANRTSTSIEFSGLSKIIRYEATHEEDGINAVLGSMKNGRSDTISAASYMVKNLDNGAVWIDFNKDQLLPIASLTKLVTAIVAGERIPPNEKIKITSDIVRTYGNTASLTAGESFTSSELLYPLLLVSSNDAAEALARTIGRKQFVGYMNAFAQSIGAYRTYFYDPSGLSPRNVSTASDFAIILEWIRNNRPEILKITAMKEETVKMHTWKNPTHFLSWSYYEGGKNGYLDEAGRTSASLFRLGFNKNLYAIVVLGSDNRDLDVMTLVNKIK